MTVDISNTFYFHQESHSALPPVYNALDQDLLAVQDEVEALERGNLSHFDPSKLRLPFSHLKKMIPLVRDKETGIDILNGCLLDLIAIEGAIESYLTIAKKVIESHGKSEQAREIQKFIKWASKVSVLKDLESSNVFWELCDAMRHPFQTIFPSLETQKNHARGKFFNKVHLMIEFFKRFTVRGKLDPSKQLVLQREVARLAISDMNAGLEMETSRKYFWNGAFSLLQLFSVLIQSCQRESIDNLVKREVARHEKPHFNRAQEKEVAFIGKSIAEKLQVLRAMSEEEFHHYTQRYPKTRPFLDKYRKEFFSITPDEIPSIMDQYRNFLAPAPPIMDVAGAFISLWGSSQERIENQYRFRPCPPRMQKFVVFTYVKGGRGDVAAAAKAVDLIRNVCPASTIDWVLRDAKLNQYDPISFLNNKDSSKIDIREWLSEPSDKTSADFLLIGPTDPDRGAGIDYLESRLGRKIEGPLLGFLENAHSNVHSMSFSKTIKKENPLVMGLQRGSGVFLDRSRIEAPLSLGYCCPSYISQIQDIELRKDILGAMNIFNDQSSPDYNQYSFNSGYAHRPVSWAKFIDSVALHEHDKHVVIVLNQHGEFDNLSTQEFQDQIFTPERLAFLKQKGYGTVALKGQGQKAFLLQETDDTQLNRHLTVITRSSFDPNDMRRMQLASERLLATGDNSAAEAWGARCKLYLYEDVANGGSKWRFLEQQVDLAQTISPNLAKLLALFGGDSRLIPEPSLNKPFSREEMVQMEQLLNDPDLGNDTLAFCNDIIKNYSFYEVLEETIKRIGWQYTEIT